MGINVDQTIEWHEEECQRCEKYLRDALEVGNGNVILINHQNLFSLNFKIGILKWRANLGSPKQYFNRVVDTTRDAFTDISIYLDEFRIEKMFYFQSASILSYLTGKKLTLPNYNTFDLDLEQKLILALANSLNGDKNNEEWKSLLDKSVPSRQNLMMKTYTLYYKLLFEDNLDKIDMLVEEGEELYRQRRKNSFYGGGPMYLGGGDFNDLALDYQLSAVLKYISYSGNSIHSWKWD